MGVRLHLGVLASATLLTISCGEDDGSVWDAQGQSGDSAGDDDDDNAESNDGPATGNASTTGGGDDDDDDDSADDTGGVKLDVGPDTDGGVDGACGCQYSYIWVANTEESTVSKINTKTLEEEGRYRTVPSGSGSPSRTAVNLEGDVAVANRYGGLVKFIADEERCEDRNGDGVIQTSTGKNDVLSWEAEECRAWHTEFNTTNQRPVAWTGGQVLPDSCDASSAKVWTVASTVPGLPGTGGPGGVTAYLVDGETGQVEESIDIPQFDGALLGAYGGAVDKWGNLYFTSQAITGGTLARVDRDSFAVEIFPTPQDVAPYGITVDHVGRVWLSSVLGSGAGRFDYSTNTWASATGFFGGNGIAEDPEGTFIYVATGNSIYRVDEETMDATQFWTTTQTVKGLGFDVDGFLWAVTGYDDDGPANQDTPAFKIDVDSAAVEDFYVGLDRPYTYSDMTGSALGNVTCPPAG